MKVGGQTKKWKWKACYCAKTEEPLRSEWMVEQWNATRVNNPHGKHVYAWCRRCSCVPRTKNVSQLHKPYARRNVSIFSARQSLDRFWWRVTGSLSFGFCSATICFTIDFPLLFPGILPFRILSTVQSLYYEINDIVNNTSYVKSRTKFGYYNSIWLRFRSSRQARF